MLLATHVSVTVTVVVSTDRSFRCSADACSLLTDIMEVQMQSLQLSSQYPSPRNSRCRKHGNHSYLCAITPTRLHDLRLLVSPRAHRRPDMPGRHSITRHVPQHVLECLYLQVIVSSVQLPPFLSRVQTFRRANSSGRAVRKTCCAH